DGGEGGGGGEAGDEPERSAVLACGGAGSSLDRLLGRHAGDDAGDCGEDHRGLALLPLPADLALDVEGELERKGTPVDCEAGRFVAAAGLAEARKVHPGDEPLGGQLVGLGMI